MSWYRASLWVTAKRNICSRMSRGWYFTNPLTLVIVSLCKTFRAETLLQKDYAPDHWGINFPLAQLDQSHSSHHKHEHHSLRPQTCSCFWKYKDLLQSSLKTGKGRWRDERQIRSQPCFSSVWFSFGSLAWLSRLCLSSKASIFCSP